MGAADCRGKPVAPPNNLMRPAEVEICVKRKNRKMLEIARLWPHLMRDVPLRDVPVRDVQVRDVPVLECRSSQSTH